MQILANTWDLSAAGFSAWEATVECDHGFSFRSLSAKKIRQSRHVCFRGRSFLTVVRLLDPHSGQCSLISVNHLRTSTFVCLLVCSCSSITASSPASLPPVETAYESASDLGHRTIFRRQIDFSLERGVQPGKHLDLATESSRPPASSAMKSQAANFTRAFDFTQAVTPSPAWALPIRRVERRSPGFSP